jgi:tetratricopeptide (TPR) repeat protein
MEKELDEINKTFQSGEHKQAVAEIQILIEKFSTDDRMYKAYDLLGDYLNFTGQQVEAVQAWTNALKMLADHPGGIDQLNEMKLIDWINISIGTARIMHRQGKIKIISFDKFFSFILGRDGSGVSYQYDRVCYTSSKMNESEEAEWKKEQFQTAIKHYKAALDKIPENNLNAKSRIRIELADALFDVEDFDEAVKIYEDAFNLSISHE